MTLTSHDTFAAFVGIDWADATHDGCLQAAGSAKRECFQLAHTPEVIDAWVTTLRIQFHGHPVAICLELNKGPLVFALRTYDFLVLFPMNPLTLARYREAFTPSRAKEDPSDAELQLERLLTHRAKLPATPSAKPHPACPRTARHTSSAPGRGYRAAYQPPHQYAEKLLPAGAPLVCR
jgi:transposase